MDWNKFAREVHEVAVKNGWWDKPRSFDEVICECLVHLGRAYEEHRNGRPNYYHLCEPSGEKNLPCDWDLGKPCPMSTGELACEHRDRKPHGVAAELGECVLGVLDYAGTRNIDLGLLNRLPNDMPVTAGFPTLVINFAFSLERAAAARDSEEERALLLLFIGTVLVWLRINNIDIESILRELHECEKARAGRREVAERG